MFTQWNSWTKTDTFLLVEKLSSSTQAQEWQEVVEQVDNSCSFEQEALRIKARRKYAVVKAVPFESVTVEDVERSPQGLHGWADLHITVPGIEDAARSGSGDSAPTTPASSISRKRSHSSTPEEESCEV